MTTKERKEKKHSLKTDIDSADLYIRLAIAGEQLGAKEDESTLRSREYLVSKLEELRESIETGAADFISEINRVILMLL